MNKAYLIFALILIVLVIGYIVARDYLSSAEDAADVLKVESTDGQAIQELKDDVDRRLVRHRTLIDQRLDSLEHDYRENIETLDSLIDSLTAVTARVRSVSSDDSTGRQLSKPEKLPDSVASRETTASAPAAKKTVAADAKSKMPTNMPTATEAKIYNEYLKRRWALPGDLTKYELKIAKQEIHIDLGKKFGKSEKQIADTIDKVYEFRKKGRKK